VKAPEHRILGVYWHRRSKYELKTRYTLMYQGVGCECVENKFVGY
jgi:hypothetical protein